MKKRIPKPLFWLYHWVWAFLSAVIFRFPSRNIIVIGVTGTNGKSTVVDIVHEIFVTAGFRVASVSSIRFIIDDEREVNDKKVTMPGRFFLQQFLRKAVGKKCDIAIIEVTSEGILQSRHRFIQFDVAALTNITEEHIEAHGSFDNYKRAKLKLFRALARSHKRGKSMILNGDDSSTELFLHGRRSEAWIYGIRENKWEEFGHSVVPQSYIVRENGIKFLYKGVDYSTKLLGEFNVYNVLCALSIALSRGVDPKDARAALEKYTGVPGRVEFVARPPQISFSVVVDYGHTPDALLNVYKTLKPQAKRLICVFGATGGGRDRWKRPEMGKIAESWCEEIILTNDDPYDENPESIINEIQKGITSKKPLVIVDRKEAIKKAISIAEPDDVVVITGKGSEPVMVVEQGKKIPWDDREIARDAISELFK